MHNDRQERQEGPGENSMDGSTAQPCWGRRREEGCLIGVDETDAGHLVKPETEAFPLQYLRGPSPSSAAEPNDQILQRVCESRATSSSPRWSFEAAAFRNILLLVCVDMDKKQTILHS